MSTYWDLLRQVEVSEEQMQSEKLLTSHLEFVAKECQREKGKGFVEYLRWLGGLSFCPLEPTYAITPVKRAKVTRYGTQSNPTVGLRIVHLPTGKAQRSVPKEEGRQIMLDLAANALTYIATSEEDKFDCIKVELGAPRSAPASEVPGAESALVQIELNETFTTASFAASNDTQRIAINVPAAANYTVLAAAGAGKTHVLIERVRFLLANGVDAASIVLATFTREAAASMAARLHALGVVDVQVGTMHSLSGKWLAASRPASPLCGGEKAKRKVKNFDEIIRQSTTTGEQDKYLLVDEAQDLSPDQWAWVRAHAKHSYVVGDLRQAIYGWRGAKKSGLLEWAQLTGAAQSKLFEEETLVDLPYNRRSGAAIVALGNAIAGASAPAIAVKSEGEVLSLYIRNENAEAAQIAQWLGSAHGTKAVIARTNTEVAFLKARLTLGGLDVPVMTIHESKGQEWDSVVLACGKRKPSEKSDEASETWYVGVTRAIRSLLITSQGALPEILEDALTSLKPPKPKVPKKTETKAEIEVKDWDEDWDERSL